MSEYELIMINMSFDLVSISESINHFVFAAKLSTLHALAMYTLENTCHID